MTPNAARGDTVRPAASGVLALALLAATPAVAGDLAYIDYLGYSADGRYFAFEEYGIQDGSGFPFSNIFVVDLPTDSWVSGTPVRVVVEDDWDSDLAAARAQAASEARPILNASGIGTPAHLLAINADGDPRTGDGRVLDFGRPGYVQSEVHDVRRLALDVVRRPAAIDCEIIANETYGFALSLDGVAIHTDAGTLPRSRGCAMDYKIYAVLRPIDYAMIEGGVVAVIAYYPYSFEGPDRRFLVVPLGAR